MADDEFIPRRRRSDRHLEGLEFEGREQFRPRRPDESDTDYHLARVDAKVELSLRRSHQLHNAVSALYTQADILHLALLGDPDLGAVGALPALKTQIGEMRATQAELPGKVTALVKTAINDAADDRDLHVYRGLKKWIVGGVGTIVTALIFILILVLLHLDPTNTPTPLTK